MRINLASNRLAFILIAMLVLLIIISAVVPQRNLAEGQILDWQEMLGENYRYIEQLGLDRIYYSPVFFIVLGLLAINLTAGNVRRFRTVYRAERTLLKLRHVGSIVFHFSLLLIIGAAILNYLTRFEGTLALTEGNRITDSPAAYFREFRGPLCDFAYGNFDLIVSKVTPSPDAYQQTPTTISLEVGAPERNLRTYVISTNHPLQWRDLELHYGMVNGYSPEVVLADSTGKELVHGFVRLAVGRDESGPVHRDFLLLPEHGLRIDLEVQGDTVDGEVPVVAVTVLDAGGFLSQPLFQGALAVGEETAFAGYKLKVSRLRRWAYIMVINSIFLNVVFAGFWLALGGLLLGFAARLRYGRKDHDLN